MRQEFGDALRRGIAHFEQAAATARSYSGDVRVEGGLPVVPLSALRIVDRFGGDVNFQPNKVQKLFLESVGVGEDWRLPRGKTHVILKERQTGITTIVAGLLFIDTITHRNRRTAIITHREETSREVFRIYERFHRRLLEDYPFLESALSLVVSNRQELIFDHLGGWIKVAWCRQQDPFSGETVHNIHWSEPAKYNCDVDALRNSVLGATDPGFLTEFIESTAKGRGNWFHQEYLKAKEGVGGRVAHFYPWPLSGKNRLPMDEDEPLPDVPHLTPEWLEYERQMVEKFGLEPPEIKWWRITKDRLGAFFEQEYPIDDHQAFLAAEHSYIPKEVIIRVAASVRPPVRVEMIGGGELRIFDPIDPKGSYVIGLDPATGEANEAQDPDYSALTVLSREGGVVATWKGRVPLPDFAELGNRLGMRWNNALLVVERNSIGIALIQMLRDDYGYPNMFQQKSKDVRTGGGMRKQYGFHTSRASKRLIVDNLIQGIRDESVYVYDDRVLDELTTFEEASGKLGARVGHDDLLISLCLAYYGALYYPSHESSAIWNYSTGASQAVPDWGENPFDR